MHEQSEKGFPKTKNEFLGFTQRHIGVCRSDSRVQKAQEENAHRLVCAFDIKYKIIGRTGFNEKPNQLGEIVPCPLIVVSVLPVSDYLLLSTVVGDYNCSTVWHRINVCIAVFNEEADCFTILSSHNVFLSPSICDVNLDCKWQVEHIVLKSICE